MIRAIIARCSQSQASAGRHAPRRRIRLNELTGGVGLKRTFSRFVLFNCVVQKLGVALDHFPVRVKFGLHTGDFGTDGVRGIGGSASAYHPMSGYACESAGFLLSLQQM